MSEPYQGGPYDNYGPHHQPGATGPWQGHDQQVHQPGYDPQLTQQWQGQTWETQIHPQTPAAPETPYPPPREHPYQAQPQAPDPYVQQQYVPDPEPYVQPQPQAPDPGPYVQQQYVPDPEPYVQPQPQAPAPGPYVQQQYVPDPDPYVQQQYVPDPEPYVQPQPQPQAPDPYVQPYPQPRPEPSAGPGPGVAPGYGPATLAGNARITDAQRARLEGRSPVIEPGMQPALLTAVLGLLLAVTAPVAPYILVVPLVLLQAVTAAGWFRLNGMWPARQGIALAFAGALTADVAVLAVGRHHAPAAILGPLAVWVLLSLVLQLRSHASPDERMYGLMATVASTALSVLATGYLGADPHAVSVGAAAVAVAVLARALPLPTPVSVAVSLLAAAGAGIAVGGMTGLGAKGALLGGAAAACALIGHRAAGYDYPSRFVHFTAGVALPLSAAAPVVWVLGRALG